MLFCNTDAVKPVCRERGALSEGLLSENMSIKSQCLLLKLFISSPLKKKNKTSAKCLLVMQSSLTLIK